MTTFLHPFHASHRARRALLAGLVVAICSGCATRPDANPRDPLEPFNRGVYAFNTDVDRVIFVPVAIVYREVTPRLVRTGVSNFFGNLEDAWSFVNSALQAKPKPAVDNFFRVAVNTFFGIGGVFDVAREMGIERQREDFGQTLGHWGVPAGPYLVLPFLGSSTVRDTVALPVDAQGDLIQGVNHITTRNSLKVLDLVDTRAGLLSVSTALGEVALDPYSFTREAYLQRRANAVFDGNPPDDDGAAPASAR